MQTKRCHTAWNIALGVLTLGLAVCVYFSVYMLRGEREEATRMNGRRVIICTFPSAWEAMLAKPCAIVESCLLGREVYPDHPYRMDIVLWEINGALVLDDEPLTADSFLP